MSFKLVILATARSPQLLYGSTLIFRTLRIGFPTAYVELWDNSSNPDCVEQLKRHAYDTGATFMQCGIRTTHHEWMRMILKREQGKVVFADPDTCYFDEMESLELKAPLTGRLTPAYFNSVVGAIEVERLHTCLLYVQNSKELRAKLDAVHQCERFPFDPIAPRLTARKGKLYFHDTFATAFGLIGGKAFTADYLARFGHAVSMSMPDLVMPKLPEGKALLELHRRSVLDNNVLKNCWADHDRFYAQNPPV